MTYEDAVLTLAEVRKVLGPQYKRHIRDAWMDGNYRERGLQPWSNSLQRIRNTFGPSWLVSVSPKALPQITILRELKDIL